MNAMKARQRNDVMHTPGNGTLPLFRRETRATCLWVQLFQYLTRMPACQAGWKMLTITQEISSFLPSLAFWPRRKAMLAPYAAPYYYARNDKFRVTNDCALSLL